MTYTERTEARSDEELAREARAGSRRAFEELALRYKRRLFVYLRPRLGSDQDAEDMVQETFLKLYRNIASYDPTYRFSTWLYTSAGRLAISSFRRKTVPEGRLEGDVPGGGPDPAQILGQDDASSGLWAAARGLVGTQFRVLWLRYAEGLTIEEIAVAVGKSQLAVRLLLHRARMNLMKRVGPGPARAGAAAKAAAVGETPLG